MTYLAAGMLLVPLCIEPVCKVSSSANGIYALISNISSFSNSSDIVNEIKELDIEISVKILVKMLKELNIQNKTGTFEESYNSLRECLQNIENELGEIHHKLAFNSSLRLLSYFRKYKFHNSINRLKILKKQLDNRTNMFFNILREKDNLRLYVKSSEVDMSIIEQI